MKTECNKDLSALHTMSCQATAENYIAVSSVDELRQALDYAKQQNLPVTILGGGSNVVFSGRLSGLLIHLHNQGKRFLDSPEPDVIRVSVEAGENWHDFVIWSLQHGLRGLENLSLIPGTVGAAPIQNIGAYGVEVESRLESVTAIHQETLQIKTFSHGECRFGYRESIFKHDAKDWVIFRVTFRFSATSPLNTSYSELYNAWVADGQPDDAGRLSKLVCRIRQSKLPDPSDIPNAGSFFKNPVVSSDHYQSLCSRFPELVAYPSDGDQYKLAAGWLIQQCGWKGYEKDGVGVYSKQALVLINPGRRSGHRIMQLAEEIRKTVKEKFGVELETEPLIFS